MEKIERHAHSVIRILRRSRLNEVTKMGLFDVFSKGGKYFGKAIEPKCEYCEHGKRTKDGDKVLCTKKGMVDCSFHCPKFTYSPLKRIPVKQMNRVGFLEGDYDEKEDIEENNASQESASAKKEEQKQPDTPVKKEEPAPAVSEPEPAPVVSEPAPAASVKSAADDLAALAAAAEAIGDYVPDEAEAPQDNDNSTDDMSTLSSM